MALLNLRGRLFRYTEMFDGVNTILLSISFIGLTMLILGSILKRYPPEKINHFYGYRTSSSMKNQEQWDHAQVYSAKEMIRQGVGLIILGPILMTFNELHKIVSIALFMAILLGGFLIVIVRTERSLRKTFK